MKQVISVIIGSLAVSTLAQAQSVRDSQINDRIEVRFSVRQVLGDSERMLALKCPAEQAKLSASDRAAIAKCHGKVSPFIR